MKINKDSWHFQLMQRMGLHPLQRRNLCSYIRGLLMSLLIPPMIVVSPLILYWMVPFKDPVNVTVWQYILLFVLAVWGVMGTIIFVVLVITTIVYLICKLLDILGIDDISLPNIHLPQLPKNNIVWEYIKAKKQNICPVVEFE